MNLINITSLGKVYHVGRSNAVVALEDVNLSIEAGESVAIIGKSGSGKSTLLNLLGCLDRPTAGQYELGGEPVPWESDRLLANIRNRRIGFVFQEFALVPGLRAWENVALPLVHGGLSFHRARAKAVDALITLGLAQQVDQNVEELSGGQRQRVAIARALINKPDLILADEPTGALDQATGHQVMASLLELNRQGFTVVVVTHDPAVAALCDRTVEISDGRVVTVPALPVNE